MAEGALGGWVVDRGKKAALSDTDGGVADEEVGGGEGCCDEGSGHCENGGFHAGYVFCFVFAVFVLICK